MDISLYQHSFRAELTPVEIEGDGTHKVFTCDVYFNKPIEVTKTEKKRIQVPTKEEIKDEKGQLIKVVESKELKEIEHERTFIETKDVKIGSFKIYTDVSRSLLRSMVKAYLFTNKNALKLLESKQDEQQTEQ